MPLILIVLLTNDVNIDYDVYGLMQKRNRTIRQTSICPMVRFSRLFIDQA